MFVGEPRIVVNVPEPIGTTHGLGQKPKFEFGLTFDPETGVTAKTTAERPGMTRVKVALYVPRMIVKAPVGIELQYVVIKFEFFTNCRA